MDRVEHASALRQDARPRAPSLTAAAFVQAMVLDGPRSGAIERPVREIPASHQVTAVATKIATVMNGRGGRSAVAVHAPRQHLSDFRGPPLSSPSGARAPDRVSHPKHAKPDMAALHLKPGELILVSENARNKLITLEDMTEEELERLKNSFSRAAGKTLDTALMREAAGDLEAATDEIEDAKEKMIAAASGDRK
jgi:hypothetical protein